MTLVPIDFIGFLVNVNDSILKLKLGDDFIIEKLPQEKGKPFIDDLNKYRSYNNANFIGNLTHYYCVTKQKAAHFEATEQGGVVIELAKSERIKHEIRNKIRLLRLFKEGNIVLHSLCLYHIKDTIPQIISSLDEWPIIDKTTFTLKDEEISQVELFLDEIKIPFTQKFLQLAFDSFELSYETENHGLSFLSLMISLESMFNIDKYELLYRTSRNAAVLLGESIESAEIIAKEIKELYKKRSQLVHTGNSEKISIKDVIQLRNYVRRAIKEIYLTGFNKEHLGKILNESGYGCKQWVNIKKT